MRCVPGFLQQTKHSPHYLIMLMNEVLIVDGHSTVAKKPKILRNLYNFLYSLCDLRISIANIFDRHCGYGQLVLAYPILYEIGTVERIWPIADSKAIAEVAILHEMAVFLCLVIYLGIQCSTEKIIGVNIVYFD